MSLVPVTLPSRDSQVESLQRAIYEKNRQLSDLEERLRQAESDLRAERAKSRASEAGVSALRSILSPLHDALGIIFGEMEEMGVESCGAAVPFANPRAKAAWDNWKQTMGPNSAAATIIDLLMLHGELTQEQMRIHIGTKRMQTVYDACSKLNKAQLIVKNGDRFSLKEL